MKKLFILTILFSFISCNALKALTNGETNLDEDFFKEKQSVNLFDSLIAFFKLEESNGVSRDDINNAYSLGDSAATSSTSGKIGLATNCSSGASAGYFISGSFSLSLSLSDSWNISFWANKGTNSSGGCADNESVLFLDSSNYVEFDNIDCENDYSDVRIHLNGTSYDFQDAVNFPGWHHFSLNIRNGGSNVDLYVDGNYFNTQSGTPAAVITSTLSLCSSSGGGDVLDGSLDSLGFWSKLLTNTEIKALYNRNNNLD